jgi:ABC-type glycerol-3-phosphate transport system substrate-binding protein
MRRRAALFLLLLAALAACRSHERTLTIAVALLPSELPAYQAALKDFEQRSGYRVVVVPQQYPDIRRALAAEAAAGTGTLDLVELDVYSLAAAADDVAVLDATALQPELAALEPQAVRAGRIHGLRFVPHRIAWQAMIYNHDVLGSPPRTWDDLIAVARAHPGRIAFKGALYEGLTCDVLPFVWEAGGSGVSFDDAGARAAFDLFHRLAPYLHPQSATFKESTVAEAMARGEIVLHLNWPFVMSLYASQGLAPDPIRSAPLPRGPAGEATVLGGGYIAIPRRAPQKVAATRLARYLISGPVQRRFRRELGWFSARRDVPVEASGGLLQGFAAMRNDVRPRPERPDYPRLSRLWQESFRAAVFEGVDPQAALARAARELSEGGR